MAASRDVSACELGEDVGWICCLCEVSRCFCLQDGSASPRRVYAELRFDFDLFERATSFSHRDCIDLWVRWHSVVHERRKIGWKYISVITQVSFCVF